MLALFNIRSDIVHALPDIRYLAEPDIRPEIMLPDIFLTKELKRGNGYKTALNDKHVLNFDLMLVCCYRYIIVCPLGKFNCPEYASGEGGGWT